MTIEVLKCKLGSIIAHLCEYHATHEVMDLEAAKGVMDDPEIVELLQELNCAALLPLARNGKTPREQLDVTP